MLSEHRLFLPSQDVKQLSCMPFDGRAPHASMQAWYCFTQALPWLEADEILSAKMAAATAGRIANAFIDVSSLCPLRRRITSLRRRYFAAGSNSPAIGPYGYMPAERPSNVRLFGPDARAFYLQ